MVTIDTTQEHWKSPRVDPFIITLDEVTASELRYLVSERVDVAPIVLHAIRRLAHFSREGITMLDLVAEAQNDPEYEQEVDEINLVFPPHVL